MRLRQWNAHRPYPQLAYHLYADRKFCYLCREVRSLCWIHFSFNLSHLDEYIS